MTNERILFMNQPNILILHLDELRQDCLGCYGNPDVQTPNIDALAAGRRNLSEPLHGLSGLHARSRCAVILEQPVRAPARLHGTTTATLALTAIRPFQSSCVKSGYHTSAVGKMHMTPTYLDIGFSDLELAEQNGCGRFEDDYHHFLMKHGKIDRFDLHYESGLFQLPPEDHRFDDCQCCRV